MNLKELIGALSALFYPRLCLACNTTLLKEEEVLCLNCSLEIPQTYYHAQEANQTAQLFFGRLPFKQASSFAYFSNEGLLQLLLHHLKYKNRKDVGYYLGKLFALQLQSCNWIKHIDLLVPVPLHPAKLAKRGYNQSEYIAAGMSSVLGIALDKKNLYRCRNTDSQTKKSRSERLLNMKDAFALRNEAALQHKHVLLIDDLLTTGATLESCALSLLKVKGLSISIATIGIA